MGSVSRKQPLYGQLVDLLCQKIDNEMEPGDMLPSERDLSETYGLSRTTVRLAMRELEDMGLVTRRHGKGTFVACSSREATNLMGTYSFTEQMRSMGRVPKTRVLEFGVREANKALASKMELSLGEHVIRMRRLRLADDVPMMVESTYLPAQLFMGLTREAVEATPLYDLIEQEYGQRIEVAEEAFCARLTQGDEATLLEVPEDSAVLHMKRVTRNDKNLVIEYTRSVARADQFEYKIAHTR